MNTLGWADNSGNELFTLGWYQGQVVVVLPVLETYTVSQISREDLSVLAERREVPPVVMVRREDVEVYDMARELEVLRAARSSDVIEVERDQVTLGFGTVGYQTDVVFPRGSFTNVQIVIRSNEELGILDSGYIEDYDGTDGYVTLRRVSDGSRTSYPAVALPGETPEIDNDVFQITVPLSSLQNEVYELEARVRDITGNYTIIGAVSTPLGGEDLSSLSIEIVDGFSVQYLFNVRYVSIRPTLEVVLVDRGK